MNFRQEVNMASENFAPSTSNESENSSISMVDVLREEEELEADATAVLGDSDVNNCTYPRGYVPRQALYACLTCKAQAGICLACSYECHEGHDICELYTKRNFQCDCGNDKFPNNKCKLYSSKEPCNTKNIYNQNFSGVYCVCSRPYPDPEDEIEDEMIQCIVCEDWYHGRHLGDTKQCPSDFDEMICCGCMSKFDFLWAYNLQSQETRKLECHESKDAVDVGGKEKEVADDKGDITVSKCQEDVSDGKNNTTEVIEGAERKDTEKNQMTCSGDTPTSDCNKDVSQKDIQEKITDEENTQKPCLLKELQARDITVKDCATFWKSGWRSKLCKCSMCMEMYEDRSISFILDESDTVTAYEKRGQDKQTPSSQYDRGLQALSHMDRVQQVEVIQGFNDMKSELSSYLKKFADNGKVVREEDIREFFSQMEAKKRQRTVGPFQYLCK